MKLKFSRIVLFDMLFYFTYLLSVLILANIDAQDFPPRGQPNKKLLLFKVAKNILMA